MRFYIKEFEQSFVDEIKKQVEQRNRKYDFNNLPSDKGNRWVGVLGELALKEYLDGFEWVEGIDYIYNAKDNDKCPFDFTINELKLDVKTVATKYFPRLDYGCNLDIDQFNKPECNSYVFGRFILNENKVVLMGWITKDEFEAKKVTRLKGSILHTMEVEKDFYEVEVNKLTPLTSLMFYGNRKW